MYPSLTIKYVKKKCTLQEFIEGLGENYLYSYNRRTIGVLVNNRRPWPSAKLKPGDKVVIYPIIVGG
jgi:hypothetical protein